MKRAVLLHGTDGSPDGLWLPWLKAELESRGYEVWAPLLPENHTPNRKVYNDFLLSSGWDFSDALVIGHSSGAVSVLNLLQDERFPKINLGVLLGVWTSMEGTTLDRGQFKDLFPPEGFDVKLILSKTDQLLLMHGDDDPLCPLEQAQQLAQQTESEIIIIPGGGHLTTGYADLPRLVEALETRHLL